MTRANAIKQLATEMISQGICSPDHFNQACLYLSMAYGAGYDKKRKGNSSRLVGQYKDNKLIKVWESVISAARALGTDESLIRKCAKGRIKQTKGYSWRYLDAATVDAEETIGLPEAKLIQPEQGTHVSKISSL